MKPQRALPIGDLIRQYLRDEGLETPLNELRLMTLWPEVMGRGIAAYTGNMYVGQRVLYVEIRSAALRANLMMGRKALVERLNNAVGARVIEQLVLH